jgi:hypothetical protein
MVGMHIGSHQNWILVALAALIIAISLTQDASASCGARRIDNFSVQVFDPTGNLVKQSKNMSIFDYSFVTDAGADCNTGNDTVIDISVSCSMAGTYTANISCPNCHSHFSEPVKNVTVFLDTFGGHGLGNWTLISGGFSILTSGCGTPSNDCAYFSGSEPQVVQLKNNISLAGFDNANLTLFYAEGGTLETTDCLIVEMLNGAGWNNVSNIFCDDLGSAQKIDISVPSNYLVQNFGVRLNWTGDNAAGEQVYLDNLTVTGFYNTQQTGFDVLTCYAPEDNKLVIRNQSSSAVAAFDEKGYLYLRGMNYSRQGNLNPPKNSYIIKNNTGNVVAFIDSKGNLNITGSITKQSHILSPPKNSFVIMNRSRNVVAYISSTGNLFLEGNIYFNWTGAI